MNKFLSFFAFFLVTYLFIAPHQAAAGDYTASNVYMNQADNSIVFDYDTYGNWSGSFGIVLASNHNYNIADNSSTGCTDGLCYINLTPQQGYPSCSTQVTLNMYFSGNHWSQDLLWGDISDACPEFTASNVDVDTSTNQIDFNYNTYGTWSGSFGIVMADDLDHNIADNGSTGCSGGSCSINLSVQEGYPACSAKVVLNMYFSGNHYSQELLWSDIADTCASAPAFTAESVQVNQSGDHIEFDYGTYGNWIGSFGIVLASNLNHNIADNSSTRCSAGHCSISLNEQSGYPTCSTQVKLNMYFSSTNHWSQALTWRDISNGCNDFTASNVAVDQSNDEIEFDYDTYGNWSGSFGIVLASNRDYNIADNASMSCSSGHCIINLTEQSGYPACNTEVTLNMYFSGNHWSQNLLWSDISDAC